MIHFFNPHFCFLVDKKEMEVVLLLKLQVSKNETLNHVEAYVHSKKFLRETTLELQTGSAFPTGINHYIYFKAHQATLDWKKKQVLVHVYGIYKVEPDRIPVPCGPYDIRKMLEELFPHNDRSSEFYGSMDRTRINFPIANVKSICFRTIPNIKIPLEFLRVCPLNTYKAGNKCYSTTL